MAQACMASNGNGSLVFIGDMTADRCSRIISDIYRAMDNDRIHTTKATQELCKAKSTLAFGGFRSAVPSGQTDANGN